MSEAASPPAKLHSELSSCVAALDWSRCVAVLRAIPHAQRKRELRYVFTRLLHSGAIVVRLDSPDRARAKQRDAFVEDLITYAKQLREATIARRMKNALEVARIFDEGYRRILEMLSRAASKDLSPPEHAWALLEAAAREHGKVCKDIAAKTFQAGEIVDLYGLSVADDQGTAYRPDAVLGPMIEVLGSSLMMLAYRSSWFASDGAVELPSKPSLSDDAVSRASATMILGNSWRVLETRDGHWRFFGAAPTLVPAIRSSSLQSECRSIDCVPERGVELLDRVADERLAQLLMRVQCDLSVDAAPIVDSGGDSALPLPPARFLNNTERDFVVMLESTLHVEVRGMTGRHGGLSFPQWIRGFSYLQSLAGRLCAADGSSPPYLTTAQALEAQLVQVGLDEAAAGAFLSAVTFSRTREDLFDAPLIRIADGQMCFLPAVVAVLNLPRVLLSLLSSMRVPIPSKGKGLELRVRRLFEEHGISVASALFKIDGRQYECDAAVLWDETLFLFECKNRTLSGLNPTRYHSFLSELEAGAGQLERLRRVVKRHPEVLREKFGRDARWSRIVCCVLSGLPWSAGKVGDMYFYDMSALGRFFETGSIYLKAVHEVGPQQKVVSRHHVVPLWSGQRPRAEDLLRQLRDPWQVKAIRANYQLIGQEYVCDETLIVRHAAFRRREATLEQLVGALGAPGAAEEFREIQEQIRTIHFTKNKGPAE